MQYALHARLIVQVPLPNALTLYRASAHFIFVIYFTRTGFSDPKVYTQKIQKRPKILLKYPIFAPDWILHTWQISGMGICCNLFSNCHSSLCIGAIGEAELYRIPIRFFTANKTFLPVLCMCIYTTMETLDRVNIKRVAWHTPAKIQKCHLTNNIERSCL